MKDLIILIIACSLLVLTTMSCNTKKVEIELKDLCLDSIYRVPNSAVGTEKIMYKARIVDKSMINRIQNLNFKTCLITDIFADHTDTINYFDLSYELNKADSFLLLSIISNRMAMFSKEESVDFCSKLKPITIIKLFNHSDSLTIKQCIPAYSSITK